MNKTHYFLSIIIISLITLFGGVNHVMASESASGSSASLSSFEPLLVDERLVTLTAFLNYYNSPMAGDAVTFIREAERYNLDWKFVAAIAGTESTFGKHVPRGSYNGWGWGIPTGASSGIAFTSWSHGIETVSKGLRKNYMDKWGARTIEEIGHIYAASPAWASHVRFFMNKIESFKPVSKETLLITI